MSTGVPLTDSSHGYLSEESKRRFTLVAGILGAAFFLAQFLLPMLVMFLVMMPMMFGREIGTADLDQAALWRGELWFVERTVKVDWRDPGSSATALALRHVRRDPHGAQVCNRHHRRVGVAAILARRDRHFEHLARDRRRHRHFLAERPRL